MNKSALEIFQKSTDRMVRLFTAFLEHGRITLGVNNSGCLDSGKWADFTKTLEGAIL